MSSGDILYTIQSSNSKDIDFDLEIDVYLFEAIEQTNFENKCLRWKIYDYSEVIFSNFKITSELS